MHQRCLYLCSGVAPHLAQQHHWDLAWDAQAHHLPFPHPLPSPLRDAEIEKAQLTLLQSASTAEKAQLTWAAVSGEDAGDGAGFLGGEERDDVLEDGVG